MAPQVVLVTGCSSGIGLETAVLLANDEEQRFKVFATMRNLAKKGALEKAAGAKLDKTLFIRELDVTKKESRETFLKNLKKEAGDVEILINNAGTGHTGVPEKVPEEEVRSIFEVNVFSLISLTQAVIPAMKAKKSGRIVMLSSMAGLSGWAFGDIYCASKFAVEGFSECLAPYLSQFNVGVSLIEPGPVHTNFVANAGGLGQKKQTLDVPTEKLLKAQLDSTEKLYAAVAQTPSDIAAVIKKAVLAEKPQLRYQTAEALVQQAAFKYTDPTGDSLVQAQIQFNGW